LNVPESSPFRGALRAYVRGESDRETLRNEVRAELLRGPSLIRYDNSDPDVVFPPDLDAAMYLDMILDGPDDPSSLDDVAAALHAVFENVSPNDPWLPQLLDLARHRSLLDRLREFLDGRVDHAGFDLFVSRRSGWSEELRDSLTAMPRYELERLATALATRDFASVRRLVFGDEGAPF
jgi:hypothetical protein